jgi:3'(2'), 5'-bisphosphate nucleotidase
VSDQARLNAILEHMIEAAYQAGTLVMPLFEQGCAQSKKADGSIVTIADTQAEALITQILARNYPETPILGEESNADGATPNLGEAYFCVDPIDGTQQFAKGNGEWAIVIAYIEHGRPLAGVIYAPALSQRLFAGLADFGGFEILGDGPRIPFHKPPPLGTTWRALQGSYGKPQSIAKYLPEGQALDLLKIGSAIKFGLIGVGEADVFVRPGEVWDWDIAAGQAIVEAAGGCIQTMDGKALVYGQAATQYRHPPFIARRVGLDL